MKYAKWPTFLLSFRKAEFSDVPTGSYYANAAA